MVHCMYYSHVAAILIFIISVSTCRVETLQKSLKKLPSENEEITATDSVIPE